MSQGMIEYGEISQHYKQLERQLLRRVCLQPERRQTGRLPLRVRHVAHRLHVAGLPHPACAAEDPGAVQENVEYRGPFTYDFCKILGIPIPHSSHFSVY